MSASTRPSSRVPVGECFKSGLFRCEYEAGVNSLSLHLSGELDLASRDTLQAALLAGEESGAAFSVDLSDLEFIDCAGLAALSEAALRATRRGMKLVLVGGSGQVGRVLDLVGSLGGAAHRPSTPKLELVVDAAIGEADEAAGLGAQHAL
jgi:anti-anti-sigma factor